MNIINPGKFEITIGGVKETVIVSMGLKTELYKVITTAQMKVAQLSKRIFMNEELAVNIQEKDAAIKAMETAEEEESKVSEAKKELEALYDEALSELETRQSEALNETVIKKIALSEETFAEAISCLLSKRDEKGIVTEKLETDVLLWSPKYAEAQEELTELLHAVTEYITSALKKISEISQMVRETTNAASPADPSQKV